MKVLFISSEIFPFAKSGGLGDVAASLPKALNNYADTISIMPLYSSVNRTKYNIVSTGIFYSFWVNDKEYEFEVFKSGETFFLRENSDLFDRAELYGDYEDNDVRFGVFCYAVLEYIKISEESFDILHINDWQSSLIALLAREKYKFNSKIVFTIHNLAYQGFFSKESIDRLDLSWEYFTVSKLEYHDGINLLKSAIIYSDVVTTVSPTYAKEIQTREFGCGLESLIQNNEYKLRGILNGIDYDEFNPAVDKFISKNFDLKNLENKKELKKEILNNLKLSDPYLPLFIFIGRFTAQKGIDQIINSIYRLAKLPINMAILGSGEDLYNEEFSHLSTKFANISITVGYDEELARNMYGAADFLYMPSQYEPCGLNQMIAMKYGAVPIVKEVGGLKDSVVDFESRYIESKGIGITFTHEDINAFLYSTNKALKLYGNKRKFDKIILHNMNMDFSWDVKSKEYFDLYTDLKNDWLPQRKVKEFEIPTHYDVNSLKAISVNPDTLFTYWEITNEFLYHNRVALKHLKLKLFVDEIAVQESDIFEGVGEYYFYETMDFKRVMTKIGYISENGLFVSLLESNIFIAPSSKVTKDIDIVWRNLSTDMLSIRSAKFIDETFYEVSESFSSLSTLKKRSLKDLTQQNQSSSLLAKKETI